MKNCQFIILGLFLLIIISNIIFYKCRCTEYFKSGKCEVTEWEKKGECSKKCGSGIQKMIRKILKQGSNCPELEKEEKCNEQSCEEQELLESRKAVNGPNGPKGPFPSETILHLDVSDTESHYTQDGTFLGFINKSFKENKNDISWIPENEDNNIPEFLENGIVLNDKKKLSFITTENPKSVVLFFTFKWLKGGQDNVLINTKDDDPKLFISGKKIAMKEPGIPALKAEYPLDTNIWYTFVYDSVDKKRQFSIYDAKNMVDFNLVAKTQEWLTDTDEIIFESGDGKIILGEVILFGAESGLVLTEDEIKKITDDLRNKWK